jgi:hypothetical protein
MEALRLNQDKYIAYAFLVFAILSFLLGIGFFIYGLEPFKHSGGSIGGFFGLLLILSIGIVHIFTPLFGSYAGLIVYGIIGTVLIKVFIKKRIALLNRT